MSTDKFCAKTTAAEVGSKFASECVGKTVLITGSNSGLGLEAGRVLALHGSKVILACRSAKRGEAALGKLKESQSDADVHFLQLDLGDLKSVKKSVDEFHSRFSKLDILINNAGVMACPRSLTADGVETQFGVNHLGHYYLTTLLLPTLTKSGTKDHPSRVVNLSSMAQFLFAPKEGILFDDLNGDKHYDDWERYGQSKLANVLFSNELNERWKDKNVISIALHPGVIMSTNLMRYSSFGSMMRFMLRAFKAKGGFRMTLKERQKSIPEGTSTTLVAALNPDVKPGGYYVDCQETAGTKLHPTACDKELAKKLWETSQELCERLTH